MFELTVSLGDRQVQKFKGKGDVVTIGRDPGCDLVLDNLGVSRRHAEIRRVHDRYILSDTNSTNGVLVNDHRIASRELGEGDVIRIAKFVLGFRRAHEQPAEIHDINQTIALDRDAVMAQMEALRSRFVASVSRDVFHRSDCAWIKATPSEHKVFFTSVDDASSSGRRPCKTCTPDRELRPVAGSGPRPSFTELAGVTPDAQEQDVDRHDEPHDDAVHEEALLPASLGGRY